MLLETHDVLCVRAFVGQVLLVLEDLHFEGPQGCEGASLHLDDAAAIRSASLRVNVDDATFTLFTLDLPLLKSLCCLDSLLFVATTFNVERPCGSCDLPNAWKVLHTDISQVARPICNDEDVHVEPGLVVGDLNSGSLEVALPIGSKPLLVIDVWSLLLLNPDDSSQEEMESSTWLHEVFEE